MKKLVVLLALLTLTACGGEEQAQPIPTPVPTMVGPNGGVFTTECVSLYWEYTFAVADEFPSSKAIDDKLNALLAKCPDPRVHSYPGM